MEEIYRAVAENDELVAKLKSMWKTGSTAGEMVDLLAENNIEVSADKAESLLAELQEKRAQALAAQELDDNELDQVAGGGTGMNCSGAGDCDRNFKSNVAERCNYSRCCDEYYSTF